MRDLLLLNRSFGSRALRPVPCFYCDSDLAYGCFNDSAYLCAL